MGVPERAAVDGIALVGVVWSLDDARAILTPEGT